MVEDWPFARQVAAVGHSRLQYGRKGLLLTLLVHCERNGMCDVAQGKLAAVAGCKTETWAAFIDEMEKLGLIVVDRPSGQTQRVRVVVAAILALDTRSGRRRSADEPTPAEGYPRRGVPPQRGTPAEGEDVPPAGGTTYPRRGGGQILSTRAEDPSSDPLSDPEIPAAAAEIPEGVARTHDGGGGRGPARKRKPTVMHSETADADVPERKTASLVHLFSTLVDGEATDGHEMLFADWVQSGYPLELCRRSIRFAVEEKRSERPAGSRLLPRELRPGFLRSILKRLHDEAAMPMRAGPGQRRGQRPTVAETWERGIASHGPGYYAGGHDLGADEAPERARTGGGDGSV